MSNSLAVTDSDGGIEQHLPYRKIVENYQIGDHGGGRIQDEYAARIDSEDPSKQANYTVKFWTSSDGRSGAQLETPDTRQEGISARVIKEDRDTGLIYWSRSGSVVTNNSSIGADLNKFKGPEYRVAFPVAHIKDGKIQSCDVVGYSMKGAVNRTSEYGAAYLTSGITRTVDYSPESVVIPEADLQEAYIDELTYLEGEIEFEITQTVPEVGGYSEYNRRELPSAVSEASQNQFIVSTVFDRTHRLDNYKTVINPNLEKGQQAFVMHLLDGKEYWVPFTETKIQDNDYGHSRDSQYDTELQRVALGIENNDEPDKGRREGQRVIKSDRIFKITNTDGTANYYLVGVDIGKSANWTRTSKVRCWRLNHNNSTIVDA